MSQITCCPACGTMFRVVADQLRISEGWVRCGHCTEVFDAAAQMQDGASAAKLEVEPSQPAEPTAAHPADAIEHAVFGDSPQRGEDGKGREGGEGGQLQGLLEPDGWSLGNATLEHRDGPDREKATVGPHLEHAQAQTPSIDSQVQVPSTDTQAPLRFQPSVIDPDSPPASHQPREDEPSPDGSDNDAAPSQLPSGWSPSDADHGYPPFELRRADPGDEPESFFTPPDVNSGWTAPEEDDEPVAQDLSFIRDARRRAFWQRPLMRTAVAAVALLLVVMLAAQYAVHERNRLAALHPQLVPVIGALCRPLGCSIGPLQRIDAVAIDSSAFNKLRPEAYRLSVTLKNQGAAAVAMPSLELTLTDAQDQPVLRRVLAPRELGATLEVIAGNGEWSGVVSLTVAANESAERIAGYRLLAFYP